MEDKELADILEIHLRDLRRVTNAKDRQKLRRLVRAKRVVHAKETLRRWLEERPADSEDR